MPTGARGYSDAPRITVNELLKDPLVIPALILDITQNEFIMDSVLRMGGAAPSGAVRYSESTPLYADDFPEIRANSARSPLSRRPSACPAWCSATNGRWRSWCPTRCAAGRPSTR